MDNASTRSCPVLYRPTDEKYAEGIRLFQGCPTLAATPGGRLYLGWYAGGWREPHMDNYNLLIYSDDRGKTWSEPLVVIPSSKELLIHALDIQLYTDPQGALHLCWVQNNVLPEPEVRPERQPGQPLVFVDGYMFYDFRHAEWEMVCQEPDAAEPVFSEPRFVSPGFLRCKPNYLKDGTQLYFAYDQLSDRYTYNRTEKGVTTRLQGPQKRQVYFDEAMAYQKEDGTVRMFARCTEGQLAEATSADGGKTWSDAALSGITHADSRFFVQKLPSGRVLLILNDSTARSRMTVLLSEDDGATWPYKRCLDGREELSYPDADVHDGVIYLTYDRGRKSHREILFAAFTEADIINGKEIEVRLLSKGAPQRYCDLHTHSCRSDGSDTPTALVEKAEAKGLYAVALCDHNTTRGLAEFTAAAEGKQVKAVPGVEISTDFEETELHILGLFLPRESWSKLEATLEDYRLRKEASNRRTVAALQQAGYRISYEEIEAKAEGVINRAHIAEALTEAGYVSSINEAFRRFLKDGGGFYTSIPRPDALETVRLLRSLGAVPVLAHPMLLKNEENLLRFLEQAVPAGLQGMETVYSLYGRETAHRAAAIAREFRLLPGGGSDYHGKKKPGIHLGEPPVPETFYEGLRGARR